MWTHTKMWSKERLSPQNCKQTLNSGRERVRFLGSSTSDGTPWMFRKVSSYGRYILGSGVCTGFCLLWYWKKHSQVIHAKIVVNDVQDGSNISVNQKSRNLENAISQSRVLLQRVKDEHGCPGIVAAVSVNGHQVWRDAIGLADVENRLAMTPDHVIRVASISKVLTVTALARFWQEGKLDIDKPVQEFVPTFPEKTWNNEKVTITTRQLLSHLSGIRHYNKVSKKEDADDAKDTKNSRDLVSRNTTNTSSANDSKNSSSNSSSSSSSNSSTFIEEGQERTKDSNPASVNDDIGDAKYVEFFSKKEYKEVLDALEQFKDDPLVHKPGTKFLYSTHAWSLVAAVMESASGRPYLAVMKELFEDLGLHHTRPDKHAPLIPNRSRLYCRNKKSKKLENAPYVDVSNKWAGGGFISTVGDLVKFADAMLYSYQCSSSYTGILPGYLATETIHKMWIPVDIAKKDGEESAYGLGWNILRKPQKYGKCQPSKFFVSHSGGAVGASSILLIAADEDLEPTLDGNSLPKGVSVAIIVNVDGVSLYKTAEKIATLFKDAS